ncbi:c-type cytochrome biogenesis protein CcsB [Arthrobacter roseus]|uniref:c-type cytochrome biogenesis protein CcsB n=1 Tax=Arthrobacter roseus TaxID=136274 RepID=UPI00196339AD|nr:c-type cytochrome biogenesis protein CcsB [Arthrobacter roseus]MBM7849514.1 cytochrome c-type biogenesis protein CcsB [Arthrobacter roseus]
MQSINEELGQYSELFMLLASVAYTVAFAVFVLDLVRSSKTIRGVENRAAQDAAVRSATPARTRESVTVPAGAGAGAAGSVEDHGAPPTGGAVAQTADDSMEYTGERRQLARVAVALTVVAAAVHAAAVLARGFAAHRVPWGNMYEFCTTGALVVTLVFLIVLLRKDVRFVGAFVTGLVLVMLNAAIVGFPTPVAHLVPALQSYWLVVHVSIAVISSALFTITFAMSVLQLMQSDREAKVRAGKPDRFAFMRVVPNALSLENLAYRINAIAFVGWTFTLMAGAIWAEEAWGRYWGWDTKEVWTFVIWVVYAGYLHARATRGWTGTRAAWLSIVGYLCVIFNFAIVNVFFSGLHSYSGI